MKKVIVFPGQGYQNKDMLSAEVQEFCMRNNLGDLLNAVLHDEKKLMDTEYAQGLIIATQLCELENYRKTQDENIEYVYCGFSLGEITALIASGTIDMKEGLEFARQRGKICKNFSKNQLKDNTFGVAKVAYDDTLEERIIDFNVGRKDYEKISITNYIPTDKVPSRKFVTITSENSTLIENLPLFNGSSDQKVGKMQCPFHSEALMLLVPKQRDAFDSCITEVNSSCLCNVICTRTAEFYNPESRKKDVNKSLAKYLVSPMQTEKTLECIKNNYLNNEILVTMGKGFADALANQYGVIGGNKENVIFIKEDIKKKELDEQEKNSVINEMEKTN